MSPSPAASHFFALIVILLFKTKQVTNWNGFWYNEIVNAVKKTHDLNDFRLKKAAFLTQNRLFSTDFKHFYALTSMQNQLLDIKNNGNQRTERGILTNQTDQWVERMLFSVSPRQKGPISF